MGRTEDLAQWFRCLPREHKDQSLIPVPKKKQKKQGKRVEGRGGNEKKSSSKIYHVGVQIPYNAIIIYLKYTSKTKGKKNPARVLSLPAEDLF